MGVPGIKVLLITFICMAVATSCEWVDYSPGSMISCCSDIPVESCEPWNPASNAACRDVCHYGGCRRGGQCMEAILGFERFCHCNC